MTNTLSIISEKQGSCKRDTVRKIIDIDRKQRSGPKMLPCATPEVTGKLEDKKGNKLSSVRQIALEPLPDATSDTNLS